MISHTVSYTTKSNYLLQINPAR